MFIVGCPRSGTTLLRRVVDAHPEIAITREETHWVPELFHRRVGVDGDGRVTRELVDALAGHRRVAKLHIDRAELDALLPRDGHLSYADFGTAFFDLYARKEGKPLAGDKTPGYVRSIPTLHALWPAARFVHLIRDGRDVCLSVLNWTRKAESFARRFPTWAEDRVTTAALWWRWHVSLGRREGASLGADRYCEIRYEALVHEPEAECRRLCDFLGVAYDGSMLRFHEGRTQDRARDAKHGWWPITPGLRDWRTDLPPEEVERFEAAAGDLLEALGYARARARPSGERLAHARRLRDVFAEHAPSADRALPEGW